LSIASVDDVACLSSMLMASFVVLADDLFLLHRPSDQADQQSTSPEEYSFA